MRLNRIGAVLSVNQQHMVGVAGDQRNIAGHVSKHRTQRLDFSFLSSLPFGFVFRWDTRSFFSFAGSFMSGLRSFSHPQVGMRASDGIAPISYGSRRSVNYYADMLILLLLVLTSSFDDGMKAYVFLGKTPQFYLFVFAAIYAFYFKQKYILYFFKHPSIQLLIFITIVVIFVEQYHVYTDHELTTKPFYVALGASVVASFLLSFDSLRLFVVIIIIRSLLISLNILVGSYHIFLSYLSGEVRSQLHMVIPFNINLNYAGSVIAIGVVFTFILFLILNKMRHRLIMLGLLLVQGGGLILTVSRGAYVAFLVSIAASVYFVGRRSSKLFFKGFFIFIPLFFITMFYAHDIISSRWQFSIIDKSLTMDAREKIWRANIVHFPEYALAGVGYGNFHRSWGYSSLYSGGENKVFVAHNAYIQVLLYWGIWAAIPYWIAWLYLVFQALNFKSDLIYVTFARIYIITHFFTGLVSSDYAGKDHTLSFGMVLAVASYDKLYRNRTERSYTE